MIVTRRVLAFEMLSLNTDTDEQPCSNSSIVMMSGHDRRMWSTCGPEGTRNWAPRGIGGSEPDRPVPRTKSISDVSSPECSELISHKPRLRLCRGYGNRSPHVGGVLCPRGHATPNFPSIWKANDSVHISS